MTDRYRRVEEALRVAIPFCETDGHAAREMHALTEDVSEQIAAVTAYWAAEIERRDNAERDRVNRLAEDQKSKQESRAGAERDRINRAAKERKSSAEQEQRANAERDRLNRLAQKHRADEQAVQDEANAAFFAEKEQEQQTKAEQKTPSLWDKEKSAVVFVVGFVLLLIAAGNCNSDPDCLYGANGQEICRSDFYDPNEDRIPGRG
jgi:hypothetical protein